MSNHIVMRDNGASCLNCQQAYEIETPMPARELAAELNGFIEAHKDCKPKPIDEEEKVS